ncbi:MAG: hypothetical protein E3J21_18615 [Anaerolineales bacterium]|nr:MAG: hypothetical protein E3J21_18615 [Anaerolineales bacterium]
MLFLITQTHTPETCPIDAGGREILHEKPENVPGLKIVAGYGSYTEHILYYIMEADDYDTVEKFLCPGFKRCTATITPVSQFFGK